MVAIAQGVDERFKTTPLITLKTLIEKGEKSRSNQSHPCWSVVRSLFGLLFKIGAFKTPEAAESGPSGVK